jgi:hypothetical protein
MDNTNTTAVTDETLVKWLLPRAWFTKRGPGIEDRAQRAYREMTPNQQEVARTKFGVPKTWRTR